ncbi:MULTISPECIES: hypothetical protein [Nocardia]|uniref:hypothetical protein n=1 Tax=Nocardia TaxID=1817 RepID=UPI00189631E7|nr:MULTISPECIES: hypothetical protein [Nocardia]MBF6351092.1 hypothetical protein [Nocardia flavorosea]
MNFKAGIVLVCCISMFTSGCSLVREALGTEPKKEPLCVGRTFDLWGTREVLGPAEPFNTEVYRAAMGAEPVTLDAMAVVAGWQGAWDRIIDVPDNTDSEYLNKWAGTTSVCWEGFMSRDVWTDESSEGVFLFMDGKDPVQVLWYKGSEKYINTNVTAPIVYRHDVLVPRQGRLERAK